MMRSFSSVILFALILLNDGISSSQNFTRYSVQDGLAQSTVHAILQDRKGFLWIGTDDGLNRYDGYEFGVFRHRPDDSSSLSTNRIRSLCEDRDGRLWVGTRYGLNVLSFSHDQGSGAVREMFNHFFQSPDDSLSLDGNEISTIFKDMNGTLWIGTATGLNKLVRSPDDTSARFVRLPRNNHPPLRRITSICQDPSGPLWMGTLGAGLKRFHPDTETFESFMKDTSRTGSISSNFVVTVHIDRNGTLWAGTYGGGLNRFNREADTFSVFHHDPRNSMTISDNRVYSIKQDHDGHLWVGTFGGGLNKFSSSSESFSHFHNIDYDQKSLNNDYVRVITIDRSRNLWVGTNKGLNKLDLKPVKFVHYSHDPKQKNSLSDNIVLSVFEKTPKDDTVDSVLWVGTNKGLDRIDQRTNTFTHFPILHNIPRSDRGFVYALRADHRGDLWIGTFGGGVFRFNEKKNGFKQYVHDPSSHQSLLDNRILTIKESSDKKRLWIGTVVGLCRFNSENNTFSRDLFDGDDSITTLRQSVAALCEDNVSGVWAGTNAGVFILDFEQKTIHNLRHEGESGSSLSSNIVNSLYRDSGGTIWIGTENGLNRYDPSTKTVKFFFQEDGLPNNVITDILGDRLGRLWIATHRGLCVLTEHLDGTATFRSYGVADGLQSMEFNGGASFQSPSGELFFGGVEGLNRFFPENIRDNTIVPPVAITAFRKSNNFMIGASALGSMGGVELSYDDRFFSFEFAALDFASAKTNLYEYKLEGFDRDWVGAGNRRVAMYTNIDAGNYVFRVRASNTDGVWNEAGDSMPVRIHPPFWERWWFRTLAVLCFLAIGITLYRYRVSKIIEIERMRVRIASDLHDEIGSSLTKISLYSDLMKQSADEEKKLALLQRIGSMSREVIGSMSDIVWSIDARSDTAQDLIDRMRDTALTILAPRNIVSSFHIKGMDLQKKLPVEKRQNLYLIFKEAITNVAKHSNATAVEVRLANEQGKFSMTLHDNGNGFKESGKKTGNGLRNMKMRAERIHARCNIENDHGVRISIVSEPL